MGDTNKPELENDAQRSTLARRDTDSRVLTAAEFRGLSDVPPEVEWFANITNPNTRRAYQNDVRDFMLFAGIRERLALMAAPEAFAGAPIAFITAGILSLAVMGFAGLNTH